MSDRCFFTGQRLLQETKPSGKYMGYFYSDSRGCGRYFLDDADIYNDLSIQSKLNCASETIKLNKMRVIPYWYYDKTSTVDDKSNDTRTFINIRRFENIPIEHSRKKEQILTLAANKLKNKESPFDGVTFLLKEMYKLKICNTEEFYKWLKSLESHGLIEEMDPGMRQSLSTYSSQPFVGNSKDIMISRLPIVLTDKGWENIGSLQSVGKGHAFIAMAFTDEHDEECPNEIRTTIKDACESLGWESKIVNEQEFNNGIMDKVISLIDQASFVVVELTHHKNGVYYEAGYAKGKGIPVIHVVSKEHLESCHFDVQHLNLITWENSNELREKLINRIRITIGERSN